MQQKPDGVRITPIIVHILCRTYTAFMFIKPTLQRTMFHSVCTNLTQTVNFLHITLTWDVLVPKRTTPICY